MTQKILQNKTQIAWHQYGGNTVIGNTWYWLVEWSFTGATHHLFPVQQHDKDRCNKLAQDICLCLVLVPPNPHKQPSSTYFSTSRKSGLVLLPCLSVKMLLFDRMLFSLSDFEFYRIKGFIFSLSPFEVIFSLIFFSLYFFLCILEKLFFCLYLCKYTFF